MAGWLERFRFRWGIARVLALSMVLVVALAVGLITALDIKREQDISREKFEKQGLLLAHALNESLANPLYFLDMNRVRAIADTAASQTDVRSVQVFSPDGRLLVDTGRPIYAAGFLDQELLATVTGAGQLVRVYRDGALEVYAPVRVGRQHLGGVHFSFDTGQLNAEIRSIAWRHIWQGLLILAVAVGLAFLVARHLARPLNRLVEATKTVGDGEGTEPSLGNPGHDEIGELTAAFEEMRSRLGKRSTELHQAIAELEESRHRIVHAQEELRKDIAEQLHGPVQSRLLVASHWLLTAQKALDSNPNGAGEYVQKAAQLIKETTEGEVRNIAHRLHPSLIRLGLLGALRSLADTFWPRLEVEIHASDDGGSAPDLWRTGLSEDLRLGIYRVVEEASNNVQKHSMATKVTVTLDHPTEDWVSVTVQDNGQGFDVQATTPGFGILSMQDYSTALGGTLEVQSQVGKGTVVIASFPLAGQLAKATQAADT